MTLSNWIDSIVFVKTYTFIIGRIQHSKKCNEVLVSKRPQFLRIKHNISLFVYFESI